MNKYIEYKRELKRVNSSFLINVNKTFINKELKKINENLYILKGKPFNMSNLEYKGILNSILKNLIFLKNRDNLLFKDYKEIFLEVKSLL